MRRVDGPELWSAMIAFHASVRFTLFPEGEEERGRFPSLAGIYEMVEVAPYEDGAMTMASWDCSPRRDWRGRPADNDP